MAVRGQLWAQYPLGILQVPSALHVYTRLPFLAPEEQVRVHVAPAVKLPAQLPAALKLRAGKEDAAQAAGQGPVTAVPTGIAHAPLS